MARIYCVKCGLRGDSKCPHCRNIFPDSNKNSDARTAQATFELCGAVRQCDEEKEGRVHKYIAGLIEYAESSQQAIERAYTAMYIAFNTPGFSLRVECCLHEWALMPGEESEIGCGHVGKQTTVPPDPYDMEQ
jgi:hypothetical protein